MTTTPPEINPPASVSGGDSIHDYIRAPTKRAVAELLYQVQQGLCQLCKERKKLEIDHMDGNPSNWSAGNLRLLCHACNIAERNRLQGSTKVREREKTPVDATENAHESIDYQAGSPEMQGNDLFEVAFRNWARAKLLSTQRPHLKRDLINGGAEEVGCSPTSTRRYLDKMTSPEGEFKLVKTSKGRAVWWREA